MQGGEGGGTGWKRGEWNGAQAGPAGWIDQITTVTADVLATEQEENHRYGMGFWCNDRGKMWPGLPRDSFAASGDGKQHVWVCPGLDLIVARSPGSYDQQAPAQGARLLEMIAASIE